MFYVSCCQFTLISISKCIHTLLYSITFSTGRVLVRDQSIGTMVGVGCELKGLSTTLVAGSTVEFPHIIHQRT